MNRSRLSRRLEKQSQKSLILSIVGIIFVLFALFKFGVPLLANFGLFIANFKESGTITSQNKLSFVAAPILNPLPTATNSATLAISGYANAENTIWLYVNGEPVSKNQVEKDGTFSIDSLKLSKGENEIFAKTVDKDNKESEASSNFTVIFKDTPPSLTIDSPSDGQSFAKDDKTAQVRGKTDSGVKITVNDFWAIADGDGNYSYQLPLKDGGNKIKIVAQDEAGNKTEKEIKVTYSP